LFLIQDGHIGEISDVLEGSMSSYMHLDLPILVRHRYANNVSAIKLSKGIPGHVDIPRLRQGKVGGFFWSVNM